MKLNNTQNLVRCAMIAAMYTALCLALQPFSYGMVQVRVAEALTLLPVLSVMPIWGVTVGCALANLVGFMTGANILGFVDVFVGTAATLLAAITSYKLRNIRVAGLPLLAAVPPVLYNAVAIGAELMWLEVGTFNAAVFMINAAYVGMGQAIACFGLGLPLVYMLERSGLAKKFLPA